MSPVPRPDLSRSSRRRNPTGSVKDRVAKYLVEDLEARGLLKDDSIILEPTSGNTGIALAMIGRRKGYRVALVMPDNVTNERRQMAALFGREVIDSPGRWGRTGDRDGQVPRQPDDRFVMPYQYGNEANPAGPLRDDRPGDPRRLPRGRRIRGGTRDGWHADGRRAGSCARRSPVSGSLPRSRSPGRRSRALRSLEDGFVPEILDPSLLDAKYLVSNRDAIAALRDLVFQEGIFGGPSCGAGPGRGRARGAFAWAVARSSRCCPTAAGSTSVPARSPATSTR
jgi:cysteine synthase B